MSLPIALQEQLHLADESVDQRDLLSAATAFFKWRQAALKVYRGLKKATLRKRAPFGAGSPQPPGVQPARRFPSFSPALLCRAAPQANFRRELQGILEEVAQEEEATGRLQKQLQRTQERWGGALRAPRPLPLRVPIPWPGWCAAIPRAHRAKATSYLAASRFHYSWSAWNLQSFPTFLTHIAPHLPAAPPQAGRDVPGPG